MIHFATDEEWDELAESAPVICMEIWLTLYGEEFDQELNDMLEPHVEALKDDDQMTFGWEAHDG